MKQSEERSSRMRGNDSSSLKWKVRVENLDLGFDFEESKNLIIFKLKPTANSGVKIMNIYFNVKIF